MNIQRTPEGNTRLCPPEGPAVFTIGHSTLPIEKFLEMLEAHGVRQMVDVRTIPKSRRNPQFAQDQLAVSLEQQGIQYVHLPGLGGLRHARKDSINTGWKAWKPSLCKVGARLSKT